jgi:hypothetical protein
MTTDKKPQPRAAVFVDRQSAPTVGGRVLQFGDQFDMPVDYPHLDVLDTPKAQVERWGRVRFVPGTLAEHEDVATTLEADRAAAKEAEHAARVAEYRRYGQQYISPEMRAALQAKGEQLMAGGAARA